MPLLLPVAVPCACYRCTNQILHASGAQEEASEEGAVGFWQEKGQ